MNILINKKTKINLFLVFLNFKNKNKIAAMKNPIITPLLDNNNKWKILIKFITISITFLLLFKLLKMAIENSIAKAKYKLIYIGWSLIIGISKMSFLKEFTLKPPFLKRLLS